MIKPKLIIFDLDGVLADACSLHRNAFIEAVNYFSPNRLTEEEHRLKLEGLPTKVKLELLGFKGQEATLISHHKQEITMKLLQLTNVIPHGVTLGCHKLSTYGIKTACVTNSIRATTDYILEKGELRHILYPIITNEDVKEPKPSPEGYLKAMEINKVLAEDTIIIEDSSTGIIAAKASGATVLKVIDPWDNQVLMSCLTRVLEAQV